MGDRKGSRTMSHYSTPISHEQRHLRCSPSVPRQKPVDDGGDPDFIRRSVLLTVNREPVVVADLDEPILDIRRRCPGAEPALAAKFNPDPGVRLRRGNTLDAAGARTLLDTGGWGRWRSRLARGERAGRA